MNNRVEVLLRWYNINCDGFPEDKSFVFNQQLCIRKPPPQGFMSSYKDLTTGASHFPKSSCLPLYEPLLRMIPICRAPQKDR